ncbi:MAG: zinc-dependent alcohol dehydrogenase family protein [Rhodobacteraceae bacterium]|uniref:zinc-dependent alcohol dehydrogenase family protein n=1 Tax=Celeribacter sp. HF31 TaxID=2721558 RepID=UPI00143157E8|nr:zinc-dependent alcohol dehydrogenase family protein [Celeribacter sp. HF31]NIY80864.1 zinc-dependent alcohol dehydrogenase family protein [Celeribacter sp. HF31]NVK45083.1 zinc-dependent alcohol dehydrogenase family protein [Paracoccaceae bacterium]
MKAAVLTAFNEPLEIKDVPEPELTDDGAIVEVKACGICRSDWHGWKGEWTGFLAPLPMIGGHEMSGIVKAVGKNVHKVKVGDRVVVPFTCGDGTCHHCLEGHSNVCDNQTMPGFTYNGGFAEYAHVPVADFNLIPLPEEVGFEQAAGMGCRFMTAYHGVLSVGQVKPGEWVAVYGAGGVGLSAIQIATAAGANVIAVDIAQDKLDFATRMGAVHAVNSKDTDPVEAIKEITHGGAHVSIDALGINATLQSSLKSVQRKGRAVQIGMTPMGKEGEIPITVNSIIADEVSFLGSFGMPRSEFPYLLSQVATKKLQPGDLVTATTNLSGIIDVYNDMSNFNVNGVTVITDFTS